MTALELKLATATQIFRARKGWLPVHQRVDLLRKLAALIGRGKAIRATATAAITPSPRIR